MIKKDKKGFTLIELLVVIAIIGLLSTLAVVALSSARSKARDAKRVGDIKQVQTALELFYNENNQYPTQATAVTMGDTNHACLGDNGFTTTGANCVTPFMGLIPSNPTPLGADYTYVSVGASATYLIGFSLEGTVGGLGGASTADQNGMY